MLTNGRILGISGIVSGLVPNSSKKDRRWRFAFVAGMVGTSALMALLVPQRLVAPTVGSSAMLLAGALVGFGTSMGSGCTSGHGICGFGRLSIRSLVAAVSFHASAALAARYGAGFIESLPPAPLIASLPATLPMAPLLAAGAAAVLAAAALGGQAPDALPSQGASLSGLGLGAVTSCALVLAGMTDARHVQHYLRFGAGVAWDPSPVFVMSAGALTALLAYRYLRRLPRPLVAPAMEFPTATRITPNLVVGSLVFGLGWGLTGVCPGPALASVGAGSTCVLAYIASLLGGMALFEVVRPLVGQL